jgi:hypothetical protein
MLEQGAPVLARPQRHHIGPVHEAERAGSLDNGDRDQVRIGRESLEDAAACRIGADGIDAQRVRRKGFAARVWGIDATSWESRHGRASCTPLPIAGELVGQSLNGGYIRIQLFDFS